MRGDAGEFNGPEQTVLQLGGTRVTLTRKDAEALKAALLAHLQSSALEDREYLVRTTGPAAAWIDADGAVRIGAWLLQARKAGLALTYRMPPGQEATQAFAALVSRAGEGWTVDEVRTERIRTRR